VARAAVTIADTDGLDAVTFRAVAARLGTGVMSLYNYIPDKQALVYDMAELVSAELDLAEPTGDWRADMHIVAGKQRDLAHRHPWLIQAVSHLQPLGPATLALLEFALEALEPAGLSIRDRLETISLVNGFVLNIVRAELASRAAVADPQHQARQFEMLPELLATGRYPRFAAAITRGGQPEAFDPAVHFDRLLDRILDGLVRDDRSLTKASGIVTVTDRPPSSRGRAVAVPPWIAAMDATMARPSPKPSWDVRSLSRWNGWKMRPASAGLMTGPVLVTISRLLPAMVRVLTQMSPAAWLYRTALSTRFAMRCSASTGSPEITAVSSMACTRRSPRPAASRTSSAAVARSTSSRTVSPRSLRARMSSAPMRCSA